MIRRLREWLRRRKAARIKVTDDEWSRVEGRLPFLNYLRPEDRRRLRDLTLQFLAEKQMSGARGLSLRPEMQLSIALQACLPVLELGLEWYRGWVGIIVYPGDFVIPRQEMDELGIVHEFDDAVLGEAWLGGPVLLSWFEHEEDSAGINVVIHEFAHKLDMRNGRADGLPPLHEGMSKQAWADALGLAFEDFGRRVANSEFTGEALALDPYAAEAPAEFFAVMSEAFFETPSLLAAEYPAVYEQLRLFYLQDPLLRR
ncbi:MAG: zinc-dependent peptidase [Proteobacteria bacterium]|nr:zinc-dependent peptidase [Pseudomonadota bacterium]